MQVILGWELTKEEKNIDVVHDALNIGEDDIQRKE